MELVFTGADVMCATGNPAVSTPYLLAQRAGQRLQMEFLHHNKLTGERIMSESHQSWKERTHRWGRRAAGPEYLQEWVQKFIAQLLPGPLGGANADRGD